jgi:hypothetical protein
MPMGFKIALAVALVVAETATFSLVCDYFAHIQAECRKHGHRQPGVVFMILTATAVNFITAMTVLGLPTLLYHRLT